jgi:hypothetical protein
LPALFGALFVLGRLSSGSTGAKRRELRFRSRLATTQGKRRIDLERPAAIALEFLDFIAAMIRHDRFTSILIISDGGW